MLEAKLIQHISGMHQVVLYNIFLDLHKAYDKLDQGLALEILEGYGVSPQVCRLLTQYWEQANMATRASRYFRDPFQGYRGITQGDPPPPQ